MSPLTSITIIFFTFVCTFANMNQVSTVVFLCACTLTSLPWIFLSISLKTSLIKFEKECHWQSLESAQ